MEVQVQSTPSSSAASGIPSTFANIEAVYSPSPSITGASVNPQLPAKTVVTPWTFDGDAVGSHSSCAS